MYVTTADDPHLFHYIVRICLEAFLQRFTNRKHGSSTVRIAGMNPHGIDILNKADGDHLVPGVTNHLQLPLLPAGRQKSSTLLMGLLGGLVAAIALGVAWDMLDPRVKTAREVAVATGLEVLATIPPRG